MVSILITSGPTRQYLDPVRYLTNASSGRMGAALAAAALGRGHRAVVVAGPSEVVYPTDCDLHRVETTEEMLETCLRLFRSCDGLIAAAAPCDYRPVTVAPRKIRKSNRPLVLELVETPDVVAALATSRGAQWIVAFALETEDRHMLAMQKLERKSCDLIVVNGPAAMRSTQTSVEVLDRAGRIVLAATGEKTRVAENLLELIEKRLIARPATEP